MRLAIIADPHVDCGVHGRFDVKVGMNSRTREFLSVLRWIVDYVRREVDGIVVVGDLFDSVHPPLDVIHEVRGVLESSGVPVWIVGGNHDQPGIHGRTSPNDLVTSANVRSIRGISQFHIEPSLIAVSFPIPGEYLTAEEMRLPTDEKERLVVGKILDELRPNGGPGTFVFGHLSIAGSIVGPDQRGAILDYEFPPIALKEIGFSKVFLGHVHPPQEFLDDSIVYVGSCVVPEFGQEYVPGFALAEIDKDGLCRWTRVEVPEEVGRRPKSRFIMSNDPQTDTMGEPPIEPEELLELLDSMGESGDLIRFRIHCNRDLRSRTPEVKIRQALSKYSKAIIIWEHPEEEKNEKVEFDGEIKPEEMVGEWLGLQSLSNERRERVREIALEIMRG